MGVMWTLQASVVLCFLAATCLAIDEHRPQKKDKRQLGYQISNHYTSLPSSYRLERRISTGPQYHPHHHPPYYSRPYHKDHPHSNDLLTDGNNHLEQHYGGYGPPKPHIIERPVYIKEPEPIIEIIIKESNVSLPAPPPPPPPPKKKKEQVQVFYVKYQKNPNGKGKDAIIYDKPVPAISPKLPEDEEQDEIEEAPYNYHTDLATAAPPPSTTLRTIIKPESEVYHSPSGVKVTFGKESFDYDKRSSKPEDYVPTYQKQQQPQGPQGRQLTSFSNTYFKRPSTIQGFQSPSFGSSFRQPQPYRPITFPSSSSKTFGRQQYQQPPFQQPAQFSRPSQSFNSFGSQGLTSPHFSHSISHPPPARFQNSRPPPPAIPPRQPVPYTPFDKIRTQQQFSQPTPLSSHQTQQPFSQPTSLSSHQNLPHQQQPIQFRPESHFPSYQQLPLPQQNFAFNKPPRFSQVLQTVKEERIPPRPIVHQQLPLEHEHQEFQQTSQYQQQQQTQHQQPQPLQHHDQQPSQPQYSSHQQGSSQHLQHQEPSQNNQQKLPQQFNYQQQEQYQPQQHQPQQNFLQHNFNTERPQIQQQPVNNQLSQNDHLNIVPPGGQLIHSIPKYEQHFSTVEPSTSQNTKYQQKAIQDFNSQENLQSFTSNEHVSSQELLEQQKAFERQKELLEQRKQQQTKYLEEQRKRLQEEHLKQYFEQQQQQESRNPTHSAKNYFQSTRKEFVSSTPSIRYQSSTGSPSTTTTTTTTEAPKPSTTTKDPKVLEAQLPDEVPEDLRAQLLSSGILNNADISVLDYDKVGDIPLSALPPDQLANFFNAGGAAQIGAGSEPVAARLQTDGSEVRKSGDSQAEEEEAASELEEVTVDAPAKKESVDLKVVRYDPESNGGKEVQESYVADTAETVNPVVLNDNSYSRYLPLKVNGTQFPIPDVPELKGKKISSVVVLAPVAYDFSSTREARNTREERNIVKDTPNAPGDIDLIRDTTLRKLIMEPTLENYRKFLESQNKTKNEQQSVILLVADPTDPAATEKEIFMYDVTTQTVSKLSGELSSAFVEAAEANSAPPEGGQIAASSMIETKVPFPQQDWSETGTNILERRISVQDDSEVEATDKVGTVEASDSDKTG
ncbi:unnamed protein product [Acanthoscelides obtectus]|uniref:Uncharacterized protein n=1 Tax=Acanthoscelides obtectus TaxID=200917 RepID=A0A9P0KPQ8_ACAOB|nr:unnamed protein product [Acanthoscelides obtectus]CAK1657361.1 hypothetical protein AOBTE_LOCUS20308 [Acanthoscelides obtectus]